MFFQYFRNEEVLGDEPFIDMCITGDFDDFHAIAEGARNRVEAIGRRQKQDLRQIDRRFYVIIDKCMVLFGVENF